MDNNWYLNKKKGVFNVFLNNEYKFNKNKKTYKILTNK